MDTLKSFFDLLKTNAYELLAIFLPGAAVIEVVRKTFRGVEGVAHTWLADKAELKYLALSYAVGIALQGLARLLTGSKKLREEFTEKTTAVAVLREDALKVSNVQVSSADPVVKSRAALGICLSILGDKRTAYDRFSALRDMARGLAAASAVAIVALALGASFDKFDGWTREGVAWTELAFVLCFFGFGLAYKRYAPLAEEAMYAQVIASKLGAAPPAAQAQGGAA